jgi:putative ABC transport system permease protein
VLSYSVGERTKEISLRLALGASARETVHLVVRESAVLVAAGGLLGLAGAIALARSLAGVLYGIGPFDLPAFLAAAAVLLAAGLAASLLPALRTTRVDPLVALREP